MADFSCFTASEMGIDEGKARGAMALFSEKYGDVVRVLKISGENGCTESVMEFCGGTHLARRRVMPACSSSLVSFKVFRRHKAN